MNLFKVLFIIAVAAGGYNYWRQHRAPDAMDASTRSAQGFVALPAVQGQSPSAVLVMAAEDCPHEDAQRADRLADDLSRNGVSVVRTHSANFELPGDGSADRGQLDAVMKGPLPIVFVRGRAKANPTLDEVLAEYKGRANSP